VTAARDEIAHLIESLALKPHPEGGWFREVYRADARYPVDARYAGGMRSAATSIYYLLGPGDFSAWHRIVSDETWYFHAGGALELFRIDGSGTLHVDLVGDPLRHPGARYQVTVPGTQWFGGRPRDPQGYALVSCGVAPGFDFLDFELAGRAALLNEYPQYEAEVVALTRMSPVR
jgi:hypothetical protein